VVRLSAPVSQPSPMRAAGWLQAEAHNATRPHHSPARPPLTLQRRRHAGGPPVSAPWRATWSCRAGSGRRAGNDHSHNVVASARVLRPHRWPDSSERRPARAAVAEDRPTVCPARFPRTDCRRRQCMAAWGWRRLPARPAKYATTTATPSNLPPCSSANTIRRDSASALPTISSWRLLIVLIAVTGADAIGLCPPLTS